MNSTKTQSRTGKIARLPHDIREQLNQRLLDNHPGSQICQWLNSLSETKAVCLDFARQTRTRPLPIDERNLSNWRRGGFQDWLRDRQALEQTRQLAKNDHPGLAEASAVLLNAQLLKMLQALSTFDWTAEIRRQLQPAADPARSAEHPLGPNPATPPRTAAVPGRSNVTNPAPQSSSTAVVGSPSPPRSGGEGRGQSRRSAAKADEKVLRVHGENIPSAPEPRPSPLGDPLALLNTLSRVVSRMRSGEHNLKRLSQRDQTFSFERHKYQNTQVALAMKILADQRAKEIESQNVDNAPKLEMLGRHMYGDLWTGVDGYSDHWYSDKSIEELEAGYDGWRPTTPRPPRPPGIIPRPRSHPSGPSAPAQPTNASPSAPATTPPRTAAAPGRSNVNDQATQSPSTAPETQNSKPQTPNPAPTSSPISPHPTSSNQKPPPAPATPPAKPSRKRPVRRRSAEHPLGSAPATQSSSSAPAGSPSTPDPRPSTSPAVNPSPPPKSNLMDKFSSKVAGWLSAEEQIRRGG